MISEDFIAGIANETLYLMRAGILLLGILDDYVNDANVVRVVD
jgi:hypothetical protein